MSMSQFGSEQAKDRIDRLIEEAQSAAPGRSKARAGMLSRVTGRLRGVRFGPLRSRHPGHEIRLQR